MAPWKLTVLGADDAKNQNGQGFRRGLSWPPLWVYAVISDPSSKAPSAVTGIVTISIKNTHIFQHSPCRQQTQNKSLVPQGTLVCHTHGESDSGSDRLLDGAGLHPRSLMSSSESYPQHRIQATRWIRLSKSQRTIGLPCFPLVWKHKFLNHWILALGVAFS